MTVWTRQVGALSAAAAVAGGAVLAVAGTALAAGPATLPSVSQIDTATTSGGAVACVRPSGVHVSQTPWQQVYLDPQAVWDLSEGAGVTVAVLGSGVDDSSGMLAGRLALGPGEVRGASGPARDCPGQGTFAAGLIAAAPQPGSGGLAGVAPQARVLAVGVADDTGATTPDALANAIRAAADAGARVIDVTVTVATADAALLDAVSYAIGKGDLIVAPAAPDDQTQTQAGSARPAYPAALPGVLSVSDVGPGGQPTRSPAAGTGANGGTGGARPVDLAAPGDQVVGLGPGGTGEFTASGPSYAAAFVAGTAALVLGYRPRLTEPQLVFRLEETAYHPGTTLPDPAVGYGTVDPVAAVADELPQEQGGAGGVPQGQGAAKPASSPREALTIPSVVTSRAPRQALAVTAASASVILVASLAAAAFAHSRRRRLQP